MQRISDNPTLRFTMPVIIESIVTLLIGQLFSQIIGGISQSSLASVGLITTFFSALNGLIAFMSTGSSVLVARLVGEGDRKETSRAVEQAIILMTVVSVGITLICELFSGAIVGLLLPNSEESVLDEVELYFRVVLLSYPFFVYNTMLSGILRAANNSKAAMVGAFALNVVQVASAYLFISVMGMGVVGAGLSYTVCRIAGAGILLVLCLREKRYFAVTFRGLFHPSFDMIKRMARLGAPDSLQNLSVQGGYLVANSLALGLGTYMGNVYQVVVTMNNIISLPQTISCVIVVPIIGHALGAGAYDEAKRLRKRLMMILVSASVVLGLLICLLAYPLCGLYTSDLEVQKDAARLLWIMMGYAIAGQIINVNEPALRAGGDLKTVMVYTILCVWGLRVGLSALFCYVWDFGAAGMLMANIISLIARAALSYWQVRRGKWLTTRV